MYHSKNTNPQQTQHQTRGDVDMTGDVDAPISISVDSALTIDSGYDNTLLLELPSTIINKSFGREEDYIELHIFNNANQLIYSEQNFKDFEINNSKILSIDPETILSDRGYISGK